MLSVIAVIKLCEMFTENINFLDMTILILNFCSVHLNDLLFAYSWFCTWVSSYFRSVQINAIYAFLTVFAVTDIIF